MGAPSWAPQEAIMTQEHLDHALAEEFAGHAQTIHALKLRDAHFAHLLERNHTLFKEINRIQSGIAPAEDAALERLERERLAALDQIAAAVAAAEAGPA